MKSKKCYEKHTKCNGSTCNKDRKYNGWTNYETWVVALWLDNDAGTSEYWGDMTKQAYESAIKTDIFSKREQAMFDLEKQLKQDIEDNIPTVEGMYADLLNAAISEVNWREIAENLMDKWIEGD